MQEQDRLQVCGIRKAALPAIPPVIPKRSHWRALEPLSAVTTRCEPFTENGDAVGARAIRYSDGMTMQMRPLRHENER